MKTIAEKLRELASEADAANVRLTMPQESYTLETALAAVRAAVPSDHSVKISVDVWRHPHLPGPTVEWDIWDGRNHYLGNTLTAAVTTCIAANLPADTLPVVECALGINTESDPFAGVQ